MKRFLLLGTVLILGLRLTGQTDGLIAFNTELSGNDEKNVHASASPESGLSVAWKHINMALQYDQSAELEKAIKEYGIAIKLNDTIAEAFDYRAVSYIKLGKYNKALRDLEYAIDINSGFVEAYNHLGVANYWLKEYEEAINCYTHAIYLSPGYATPYFNRAIVYLALDENELALKDLNKAKELNMDGVDTVLKDFFAEKK